MKLFDKMLLKLSDLPTTTIFRPTESPMNSNLPIQVTSQTFQEKYLIVTYLARLLVGF